jgi:serine/threonine protein kinase
MDVRLVKRIGTGAFAKVWYGLWIGQPVAVKVMKWTGTSTMMNGRPVFEGALSAELSHPNLVQTYKHSTMKLEEHGDELELSEMPSMPGFNFGGGDSSCDHQVEEFETWITQEWCDMGTLMDYCENSPPMKRGGFPEVLGISVDITSGVTYMHSRGIIHGDLTANNVLLVCRPASVKGFMCKVSDFGLSRVLEGDDESIQTQQLGTVTHMPPELFKTSGCSLSKCADIYGIGVLMWQVFHGAIPFEELTPPQVIVQVAQGLRLKMSPEAPAGFSDTFYLCTATDPNARPSGEQVLQRLLSECDAYLPQAPEPVFSAGDSDSN